METTIVCPNMRNAVCSQEHGAVQWYCEVRLVHCLVCGIRVLPIEDVP